MVSHNLVLEDLKESCEVQTFEADKIIISKTLRLLADQIDSASTCSQDEDPSPRVPAISCHYGFSPL